jgi:hypothetical protein
VKSLQVETMKCLLVAIFLIFSVSGFSDTDAGMKNYYSNLKMIAECVVPMSLNYDANGGYKIERHGFTQFQSITRKALGQKLVENGLEFEKALAAVNDFNNGVLSQTLSKWNNGDEAERSQLIAQCLRTYKRLTNKS